MKLINQTQELDGKHRVAKAILENREYIKAVIFETMPPCGETVE